MWRKKLVRYEGSMVFGLGVQCACNWVMVDMPCLREAGEKEVLRSPGYCKKPTWSSDNAWTPDILDALTVRELYVWLVDCTRARCPRADKTGEEASSRWWRELKMMRCELLRRYG